MKKRWQESKPCNLYQLIPKEKIDYVFEHSKTCSAECDFQFLGFEKVYKAAMSFVPKEKVIIDLGCGYAFQSWYFRNYKKYIGVDCGLMDEVTLQTENAEFYFISIQEFITAISPKLGYRKEDVFAICSYVPDEDARKLVKEFFPYCLVCYPELSNGEHSSESR